MAKKTPKKSKTPEKSDGTGIKVVARNRRARHDYDLLEKIEAGLALTGTEVKSLRNGKASLEEAFATVENGEAWLFNVDIPEYVQANRMNHEPKRPRKLLLHRRELDKLKGKAMEKGLTLIPLQLYFKRGLAKVEISIARGRKVHDKREAIKTREAKRDIERGLRNR